MKILVTGATSRQCNPDKNPRDVMVSWLIAEACRRNGHDVDHRDPTVREDYAEYDHVFVGIAPLHGLGSNRAYGALAAILRTWGDRLTIYCDDVGTEKSTGGFKTMLNDPNRLVKPFFAYKKEHEIAVEPDTHKWLMTGVEYLITYAWPSTLVPAFTWADTEAIAKKIPNAAAGNLQFFDPSVLVPEYVGPDEWAPERERQWVTEAGPDDRWYAQQRPVFPVVRFAGKVKDDALKRPDDAGLVNTYAKSWGVIDPALENGWWHSRLPYAVQARSLYVAPWNRVQDLGAAFSVIPDTAASMDDDLRQQWADAQAQTFDNFRQPEESVLETVNNLLGEKVPA